MRRPALLTILLLLCARAALAQVSPASLPPRRAITIADLFAIRDVRDPQLSPDGRWVAYTVTSVDLKGDRRRSRIWAVAVDNRPSPTAPLPMTAEATSASSARWSPDGRYLSFLAARAGSDTDSDPQTQVWVLDRRGGEARQLTHVANGVDDYAWSPDGTMLALVLKDTATHAWKAKSPAPWVITRLQFKRDGEGYLDSRRSHLYVFDVATGAVRQISAGDYDDSDPAWSPDSRSIAFVSNRTADPDANRNSDIWVVAAGDTTRGSGIRRVTSDSSPDEEPAWSPDGKSIAYVTNTEPGLIWYATAQLAVMPAQGGTPRYLTTSLDRNVARPRFAPDGRGIYFLLEDHGEQDVARIDLDGRNLTRPVSGSLDARSYVLGSDGSLVALISKSDVPGEVFRLAAGSPLRQLTYTNDSLTASLQLAAVQKVRFPSRDGTQVESFIYEGAGRGGAPGPALLRIHGGPVSQYSYGFNFEAQLFAARGYTVILPNPRGSSGYGEDYCKAIWADWGNKDFDDVMAAVDYAVAHGLADAKRLGVGGWSYGGILTDYVITKTDRFAGAITGASEVLFAANYGHDHYQYEWEHELGLPWKTRPLWERLSPFTNVEHIVTPTLILGGEKDWNVPVQNSEQLYQALRRLGRTTELVVYPGESHGIRKPSYLQDRLERYLAWYDRYVKQVGPTTGAQ